MNTPDPSTIAHAATNPSSEAGYKAAEKILVSEYLPIWDFHHLYLDAKLHAPTSSEMIAVATAWAKRIAGQIDASRALQQVGMRTAKSTLVPEYLTPLEFDVWFSQSQLVAPDEATMTLVATEWAQTVIEELTRPVSRASETIEELGFRIAFGFLSEHRALPVWTAFERYQSAGLTAESAEEMETKALSWAREVLEDIRSS